MHISVAMCTFNGARYLNEQLQSIREQTLLPDELVVCDDGSADGTLEILETFARSAPFPVRICVNERRLGPSKNFEKAIRECRGELIALSDQDDRWQPQKLSRLAGILDADRSLGGAFSDALLMDENSVISNDRLWARIRYRPLSHSLHVEDSLAEYLLKVNVVTGATLIIRASLREFLLPIPALWIHDGWIAWMLLLHSGIAAVAEPLISYRIHSSQHAGLPPPSLRGRIEYARQIGRKECLPTLRQLEALQARIVECPGRNADKLLIQIQEKIDYLQYRLNLPGNLLARAYRISSAWRRYGRYGKGPATMLKDLVIP